MADAPNPKAFPLAEANLTITILDVVQQARAPGDRLSCARARAPPR